MSKGALAIVYVVAFIGWFIYFQTMTWFFQTVVQGLGYFEFLGSVLS